MELTNKALRRIIKEELDAVLELRSVDGKPTTRDQRKAGYGKNQPIKPMAPDVAMKLLKGTDWNADSSDDWALTDDHKEKIEALAQSLRHSSVSGKDPDFRAHSKDQYDKLIAAIAKAKGE